MNSSPSCVERTKSTPSSLGATSIRNGSIWRPDLSCDSEWYSMCLRALLSLLLKPMLFVSLLSFLRQMTGPSSAWSSRNVPRRTPNTRAILISGARDGKSILPSIRSICSILRPERSDTSWVESCLDSRILLILAPMILLFPMSIICLLFIESFNL